MTLLLKRTAVLIFLPAGLVLLLAPFNTFQHKYVKREFVFIHAGVKESSKAFTLENRQLADYPELEKILRDRAYWFKNLSPQDISILKGEGGDDRRRYGLLAIRTQQNNWLREGSNLSPERWRQISLALFNTRAKALQFTWNKLYFSVRVKEHEQFADIPIPGLEKGRRIVGGLLLLASLLTFFTLSVKRQGIPVGRPGAIILWDMIVVSFNLIFSHASIDLLLTKLFRTAPYWDSYLQFMGVFFNLAAIPVVSLFISLTAAQCIQVTATAVISKGLFKKSIIDWKLVTGIEFSNYYSLKEIGDSAVPKQLSKVLRINAGKQRITIMEPPLQSSKREIFAALHDYAPQSMKARIRELSQQW